MTYRLPPPWNPGYALPGNVAAEGLERRAFVTKQARRGTYDDPKVGDAGYAVPTYIRDEGYGRGVYTTAWSPSGSTPGVFVPNYLNQRPQTVASSPAPGGGTAFTVAVPKGAVPAAYQRYGQKAATVLLGKLAKVPPAARPQQLKAALDGIDRKIHPRMVAAAKSVGLHRGLAHALGATLFEQVIETGRRGRAPKSGLMSLAGCGSCGSASAMGAVPTVAGAISKSGALSAALLPQLAALIPNAQSGPGGIAPGTCDASGKFIWDAGGFWRAKMAGEQCGASSAQQIPVRTGGGGYTVVGANGQPVKAPPAPVIAPGTTKLITVGPFTFPLVDQMNIHWQGALPADWQAAINKQITRDCSPCISSSMRAAGPGTVYDGLRQFLGSGMPTTINHDFFGINPGGNIVNQSYASTLDASTQAMIKQAQAALRSPTQPLAKTTRPDTGDVYGLYATMEPVDASKPYNATTNPWNLRITWRKADTSVWGWIWTVLSTIVDWAGDAISAIGSLTCDILSNPVGQVATVAGGAAVGGAAGAKAGAAGAAIGSQMCAQPPATVVTQGSSMGPLILAGAGVAAAALLLTRKKKSP